MLRSELCQKCVGRKPLVGRRGQGRYAIEVAGFGGVIRNPGLFLVLLLASLFFVAGCGGGGGEPAQQPPPPENTAGEAPGGNTAGGSTVESKSNAEALKDTPFMLNQRQPIPPDFRAAYQRKALIVVEFLKENPDSSRGIEYPQGIKADREVNESLEELRDEYPQIEFFTYDIDTPGNAETSEDLERGEYGTLAAQLEVGFTPFVVMLAPRGEEYVIENLFQGYVDKEVLDQALFDLASTDVGGNSSDVDVTLDRVELTESGGGIEYITVINQSGEEADLTGFSLQVQDPETGEIDTAAEGLQFGGEIRLAPGEEVSIGRTPETIDADGRMVVGTFVDSEALTIGAGDQVALLDAGGAVVDTISI